MDENRQPNQVHDESLPQDSKEPGKDSEPNKDSESSKDSESTRAAASKTEAGPDTDAAPSADSESNSKGDSTAKQDSDSKSSSKQFEELIAKFDSKIEQQLDVNRELGSLLKEQLESILSLRQSVLAIERTIEGSAAMKKKFEKHLQSVKESGEGLPEVHWINRVRGSLARLQRNGTV